MVTTGLPILLYFLFLNETKKESYWAAVHWALALKTPFSPLAT